MITSANRVALFAHYDRDGIIDDYVLYYLRGLRHVAERIVFVSNGALRPGEAPKLDGLAELVSAEHHGGYDFGSWQRAFAHIERDLGAIGELILANCSCFAPVYPFADVFEHMASVECDFWGPTAHQKNGQLGNIESYFMVFRQRILTDPAFADFWRAVEPQPHVDRVIAQYEVGLSRFLLARGYRLASYMPQDPELLPLNGFYLRHQLHRYRSPWLKVRLFKENPHSVARLDRFLAELGPFYPRELIDRFIERLLGTADPPHYRYALGSFRWPSPDLGRFTIAGRVKRSGWWRIDIHVLGARIPVFAFPLRKRIPR
jgi:lipopolysaccharide biosynthesis protein